MAEFEVGRDNFIESRDTMASVRHTGQTQYFLLVQEIYAPSTLQNVLFSPQYPLYVHSSAARALFRFVFCIYLHQQHIRFYGVER
jgi:hypothetical protein